MTNTENWITISSHPASRTAYQESDSTGTNLARVTVRGNEVVSPSADTDSVYRQYTSRVQHDIEDHAANCTVPTDGSVYPCQRCYPDGN